MLSCCCAPSMHALAYQLNHDHGSVASLGLEQTPPFCWAHPSTAAFCAHLRLQTASVRASSIPLDLDTLSRQMGAAATATETSCPQTHMSLPMGLFQHLRVNMLGVCVRVHVRIRVRTACGCARSNGAPPSAWFHDEVPQPFHKLSCAASFAAMHLLVYKPAMSSLAFRGNNGHAMTKRRYCTTGFSYSMTTGRLASRNVAGLLPHLTTIGHVQPGMPQWQGLFEAQRDLDICSTCNI